MRPTTRKSLGLLVLTKWRIAIESVTHEIVMMIFNDLIPESLYCQSDGFWSDPALRAEVWHKTCLIQHSLLIKMVSKWRILTTSVTFNSRRSQVDLIGWVQSDGFWQHPSLKLRSRLRISDSTSHLPGCPSSKIAARPSYPITNGRPCQNPFLYWILGRIQYKMVTSIEVMQFQNHPNSDV